MLFCFAHVLRVVVTCLPNVSLALVVMRRRHTVDRLNGAVWE